MRTDSPAEPAARVITSGRFRIGEYQPCFIIAEIGINHNGDYRTAETLVQKAGECGVDAVKFQTYVTEKRVSRDKPIYDILKQCELSWDEQKKLKALAESLGLCFFSTPFDEESADFLEGIGVALMKVASFDIVNQNLLRHLAKKKIPAIISRGMANQAEISEAVSIFEACGTPYALLHCVSSYPNEPQNAHLNVIHELKKNYRCPVGYSDHTLGIEVPLFAVAAGACIIEKHYTLDREAKGPDHAMSSDPVLFKELVSRIRELERILGNPLIRMIEPESPIAMYRRFSR